MILKRLLLLTPNNNKLLKVNPLYCLSQEKTGTQQSQPTQELLVEPQTFNPFDGDSQSSPNKLPKRIKHPKRNFGKGKSKSNVDEDIEQRMIVSKFLQYKRPSINLTKLNEILKQCQSSQKKKEKVRQLISDMQSQRQKPLLDYEAKLNLTPQLFVKNSFLKADETNNQFIENYQGQDDEIVEDIISLLIQSLYTLDLADVKRMYKQKFYRKNLSYNFLEQVLKGVNSNPKRNFLLNTLYEQISHPNCDWQELQILDIDINQAMNFVATGEYSDTNPLKFYWCAFTLNPDLINDNSSYVLKQLNKIRINQKKVQKEFKSLSYFFLTENASQKIVSKLFQITQTLKQVMDLWVLTMLAISKVKSITQLSQLPAKINFNDLFNEVKDNGLYLDYFMEELPKILYHEAPLNIFNVYQKSLKTFSQHPKDLQNLTIGKLQQNYNISLLTSSKTKIQYIFEKDIHSLSFNLFNTTVMKNDSWNFKQYKLVESIIKGQYSKALEFYNENISPYMEFDQIASKYMVEAETQGISNPDTRALYVLKEVFKQSQFFINTYQHRLNNEKLQRATTEQKQNQQNEQTSGKPSGSFKRKNKQWQGQRAQQKYQPEQQFQENRDNNRKYMKKEKQNKGLFSKKPASAFCSIKQKYDDEKPSKEQSDLQYQNYLRTAKETQQKVEKTQQAKSSSPSMFNFNNCTTIQQVEAEFKKKLPQINQSNLQTILASHEQVPIVGNIKVLLKFSFLSMAVNEQIPQGLQADFPSSFGDISKNYGEYLKGCIFMFPLPDSFYNDLLADQCRNIQRHKFKKTVAHLLLFKKQISDQVINKICEICVKQKIGLTLLQIINLINIKGINVSYNSLKKIAASIQNFKNMQSDLLQFLKKYCERTNLQIQTKLFEPYISNLALTENYETLNTFIDVLRQQLKPKQYVLDSKLNPEQNITNQKVYRQKQLQRVNNQLFEMVRIIANSLKPRTTIPPFVPQIYELYISKKITPMTSTQYGIGLVLQSQNQQKFIQLLKKIKQDTKQNNQFVLQSAIRSLMLFGRRLKGQVERILAATLFEKQFDLTETQLKNFGFIFKDLDIPGAYSEFLQFILKKQPKYTPEIKSLYYKIFNSTTDDYSKNQLSGLLDYIFNPNREKDRAEYKKIKEQEQRKQKILKSLTQSTKVQQKVEQKKQQKIDAKATKQKKKSKKEEKKLKASEKALEQTSQKKEEKQVKQKKDKKEEKSKDNKQVKVAKSIDSISMTKIASTISYDQNRKMVYNSKLWSKDLRNKAVKMFVDSFMTKYQLSNEQEGQVKEGKDKKGKNVKQAGKKQGNDKKQVSGKKQTKKQASAKKK